MTFHDKTGKEMLVEQIKQIKQVHICATHAKACRARTASSKPPRLRLWAY